jgi:hypothetical protein
VIGVLEPVMGRRTGRHGKRREDGEEEGECGWAMPQSWRCDAHFSATSLPPLGMVSKF